MPGHTSMAHLVYGPPVQIKQNWVGGAKWTGKDVIRISVCSWATTADNISDSVQAFVTAREKAIAETADN